MILKLTNFRKGNIYLLHNQSIVATFFSIVPQKKNSPDTVKKLYKISLPTEQFIVILHRQFKKAA
jgi:hypothetical protein